MINGNLIAPLAPGVHTVVVGPGGLIVPIPQGAAGGGLNVGWYNPQRGNPGIIYPNLALSRAVTPGAGAWGAWTQIVAATGADQVLRYAYTGYVPESAGDVFIQIGVGAAGAESAIAEYSVGAQFSGTVSGLPLLSIPTELAAVKVASGTRLSARAWFDANVAGSTVPLINIFVGLAPYAGAQTWQAWTDSYVAGNDATSQFRYPATPTFKTIAIGPGWTELVPSNTIGKSILRGFISSTHRACHGEAIEFGSGAAGAEVSHEFSAEATFSTLFLSTYAPLIRPVLINANERVVARIPSFGAASQMDVAGVFDALSI